MYIIPLIDGMNFSSSKLTDKVPVQKYPATLFIPQNQQKRKPGTNIGMNKGNVIEVTFESQKSRSKLVLDFKQLATIEQGYGAKNEAIGRSFINIDELACLTIQTITSQEVILLLKCKDPKKEVALIIKAINELIRRASELPETASLSGGGVSGSVNGLSRSNSKTLPSNGSSNSLNNLILADTKTPSKEEIVVKPSSITATSAVDKPTKTFNRLAVVAPTHTGTTSSSNTANSDNKSASNISQLLARQVTLHDDTIKITSFHWVGIKIHNSIFMPMYLRRILIFKSDRMIEVFTVPKDHDMALATKEVDKELVTKKRNECIARLKQFMNTQYQQAFLLSRGFELQRQFVFDALKSFQENSNPKEFTIEMTIGNKKFDARFEDAKSRRFFIEVLMGIVKS